MKTKIIKKLFFKYFFYIFLNNHKFLFKILLYFSFFFFGCFIILLLRIIKRFIHLRWYVFDASRIGHLIIDTEIYLSLKNKNIQENKFYVDLISFKKPISNKAVIKIYQKYILIYPLFIIRLLCDFDRLFINIFRVTDCHSAYKKRNFKFDNLDFINSKNPYLKLDDFDLANCENILKINGIDVNRKIIVFIIRDQAYLNHYFRGNWDYHEYRNYDIDKFELIFKELIDQGYFVIRMGKKMNKKINIQSNLFLDYAFCDFKSDILDLYLMSNAYFAVSTLTGLDWISFINNVPIAYLPLQFGFIPTNRKNIYFLPKIIKKQSVEQIVDCKELFLKKYAYFNKKSQFKNSKLQVMSHNDINIRNFIIEALDLYINKNHFDEIKNHKKFWNLHNKYCIKEYKVNINSQLPILSKQFRNREDFLND
tara:strand:+ start:3219 stop:4487 length:1269 start_codon:yes stop_codon:yes gene_type:complete